MTVRRFLPAAALLLLTATAAPAFAEAPPTAESRRPGEIARERVDEVLRSLEKFVAELPRYGLPEITSRGDILIPRKNPHSDVPRQKSVEPDSTEI